MDDSGEGEDEVDDDMHHADDELAHHSWVAKNAGAIRSLDRRKIFLSIV